MHLKSYLYFCCLFVFTCVSCSTHKKDHRISVTNSSAFQRNAETIEIPLKNLGNSSLNLNDPIAVYDDSDTPVLSQLIDQTGDSIPDLLLFQVNLAPGETRDFKIRNVERIPELPKDDRQTYSRLVTERMDDFAWENDKVAFRTYGPECQRLFEAGDPTGLISSGIDCWLKRVDYPIIDKWYRQNEQGKSYHEDHGEGLDNYHVGTSRGCGGTAVVKGGQYFLSQNFVKANIIANGPIRTIFELEYPPQKIDSNLVSQKKTFTIDLGKHFYQCIVQYESEFPIRESAVGIAHHDKDGITSFDPKAGFMTYWEPQDDSFLGTFAMLENVDSSIEYHAAPHNLWIKGNITNNQFSYVAGFSWQKAGYFSSSKDWEEYVKRQATALNNPIAVNIE